MTATTSTQTAPTDTSSRFFRALASPRSRAVFLQSLVSIIVSYELLLGSESIIGRSLRETLVIPVWLVLGLIAVAPASVLEAAWFGAGLVAVDSALVTGAIYLCGNARPDLYIMYFVLMLVAASGRRLSHVLSLSLLLSVGYAAVLYEGVVQTGALTVGHLLGVPVLLVMAVFYGVALETVTLEREQKSRLQQDVKALRTMEAQLAADKTQLETRVAELRRDLSHAREDVRDGLATRQRLERRLREAEKMEAVGRIAAGIAAEFGSLFSVIGRQTGVLLSRMNPDEPLCGAVEDIFKTGERAATLTAQLIAVNLTAVPVRDVLFVEDVLQDLHAAMTSLLPPEIELEVRLDGPRSEVEVDREGLEKVMLQLIVNARDAMPGGGRLSVSVSRASGEGPGAGSDASQVVLTIRDTGTGMNLETQAHMFEPFFSTKETNVGLGLTAVYHIVKHHGGTVEVNSRPGHGTVVRVRFPVARSEASRRDSRPRGLMAKGDETVLVVEQDEITRKLAFSALKRHRYHVLEAASSTEALMVMQQYGGAVHVAVSSLVMPDLGGRELARRLLVQHPAMKAIFVSSYDDAAIQHHRINRKYLLQHPYRQAGLVEKVREILDAA